MNGDSASGRPGELLGDLRWLQALAGRLAGGADAEDLAQDTWVTALRRHRLGDQGVRGWLVVVARNLWRRRRRDRARHGRHEAALDPPAPEPAADSLLERLELLRAVADHVRALPEPYRATVLMRYFEGRTAAEIARLTGVPAGTVRWRLKEGLDRLRANLDESQPGSRRRWVALLLPFDLKPTAGMRRGGMVLSTIAIAAATAGLLLLTDHLRPGQSSSDATPPASRPTAPAELRVAAATSPARLDPAGAAPAGRDASIEGVVHDPASRPVAGAAVVLFPTRDTTLATAPAQRDRLIAQAVTSGDGSFVLRDLLPGSFVLTASDGRFGPAELPLQVKPAERRRGADLTLSQAGALLSGSVRDAEAGAIARARIVAIRSPGGRAVRFGAVSGEDGRYRLQLPPGSWYLVAQADGYAPGEATVSLQGGLTRDLVLHPSSGVKGRVVDGKTGEVVPGATVRLERVPAAGSGRETTSNGSGHFSFDRTEAGRYTVTAVFEDQVGRIDVTATSEPAVVEVALRPGLSASGRVLDLDGRPVGGASVQLFSGPKQVHPVRQTTTDGSGRYLLRGLWRETLFLGAQSAGRASARRVLTVDSRGRAGDLKLGPEATLSVTVQDAAGRSAADAAVQLTVLSDSAEPLLVAFRRGRTDGEGQVALVGLGAGSCHLSAEGPTGERGSWRGQLAPGEKRQVTLRLSAAAGDGR